MNPTQSQPFVSKLGEDTSPELINPPDMHSAYRDAILRNIRLFRRANGDPAAYITLHNILIQDAALERLEIERDAVAVSSNLAGFLEATAEHFTEEKV